MPPVIAPITGITRSPTSEFTIPEKAAPMMTPTAKSTTLPRSANFLNSSSMTVHLAAHGPFGRRSPTLVDQTRVNHRLPHGGLGVPASRHHRQPHCVGALADERHRILDRCRAGFNEQIDVQRRQLVL